MSTNDWAHTFVVHKFGGSSLADAERFENVARILADRQYGPQGVVVSAVRGVTDALLAIVEEARSGGDCQAALAALGDTWQDQESQKFAGEFQDTMKVLRKFIETSQSQGPYLMRKAQRIEEYLNQR